MQRQDWRFKYLGEDLRIAAIKRRDYHVERASWWSAESEVAEDALKNATVTFREEQVTGGKRVAAVIDPALQRRFDECQQKIQSHDARAEEYDRWVRGFAANPLAEFQLDPDDIAYFEL